LFNIKTIGLKLSSVTPGLVVIGWGTSLASLAVAAISHGILVPHAGYYSEATPPTQSTLLLVILYYAGVFGISLLSSYLLRSISSALLGFFCSYGIGMLLAGMALDLPGLTGSVPQAFGLNLVIGVIFTAFFPFALIIGLVGALLGSASTDT
jgi:hypothetical protein